MAKAQVLARMIDGRIECVAVFECREDALKYLEQIADECVHTHTRVNLNLDERILVLSYGGDDTTVLIVE